MSSDVKSTTHRRYSPEQKERAVRLVLVLRAETGEKHGSVKRIAEQLDLAETVNGLYKTECVYGPDAIGWDDVDQLELETLSWVHWFNHDRLHSYCGDIPPAEFEAAFYAAQQAVPTGVGIQ